MRKSIKYSLLAVLAVIGLASCSNDYEYSGAEAMKNAQVFFADKTLAITSYDLDMNANSFDVEIQRVKTDGELTVALENHQNPASSTHLTVPASVTFADGADKAIITIGYNPETIKYEDPNRDTLIIANADYTTPYGGTEYRFTVNVSEPWEEMGVGQMRDDLLSLYGMDPLTYDVTIEKNLSQEGLYRVVNPYGASYLDVLDPDNAPYKDDPDDTHYMYIHAEDPDFVWVESFNSGLILNKDDGEIILGSRVAIWLAAGNTLEDIKGAQPAMFGKLEDGVITFPEPKSFLSALANVDGGAWGWYGNTNGLFAIALPGHELYTPDYSADATFIGILKTVAETHQALVDLKVGVDVAKAKYAMTDAGQSESAVAQAIVAGEIEAEELDGDSVRVYLPLEEDGKYRVTIVTYDEEGTAQESASCTFEFEKGGSSWESLGMGVYTENILAALYEIDTQVYEVEILASTKNPGLYRMKNAYGEAYPYNDPGDWDTSMDYYLEINAQDPQLVYVDKQETGLAWKEGPFAVQSLASYYYELGYTTDIILANAPNAFGTFADGVITIPVGGMLAYLNGDGPYKGNTGGEFKVVLPGAASKSAIKAAKFASRLRGGKHNSKNFKPFRMNVNKTFAKPMVKNLRPGVLK